MKPNCNEMVRIINHQHEHFTIKISARYCASVSQQPKGIKCMRGPSHIKVIYGRQDWRELVEKWKRGMN